MSGEFTRIYQFLSEQGNWKTKSDYNKDGVIFRSEFETFLEDNFDWSSMDWSGEYSNQDDLINDFWKTFDVNQTGDIEGTTAANKNAFDDKEMATLNNNIMYYTVVTDYISTLECPKEISSYKKQWKEDISIELSTYIEQYMSEGKSSEQLEADIATLAEPIINKVTAQYVAVAYLDKVMPELSEKYDYKFGSDEYLNGLINDYIASMSPDATIEEIQKGIQDIIDEYLASAGLSPSTSNDSKVDSSDSNEVNVSVDPDENDSEKTSLNELQKSVLKTSLEENLAEVKELDGYEDFSELYDNAVASFIEATLNDASVVDFDNIKEYGIEEFLKSKEYEAVKVEITVKGAMAFDENSELYSQIKDELGPTIADILTEGVYYDTYQDIINDAIKEINNGNMKTEDGNIDLDALNEWVVKEIKTNLLAILEDSGRIDEISDEELYSLYSNEEANAKKYEVSNPDKSLELIKDAALSYCKCIAAKGDKHEALLKEIFGTSNYSSIINACKTPAQINAYINEIKEDVSSVKETTGVKIKDKSDAIINDINSTLTYKGTDVSSARTSLAYRVNKDGYILFVGNNYNEQGGIWNDAVDQDLNDLFNVTVRQKIQDKYAEEISSLGLTESEKDNLFNIALFMTLSDTTVVRSMYDEMNIGPVIEEVVKNYSEMLEKISTDDSARDYIKTVENKSLFNGMGTWSGTSAVATEGEVTEEYNRYFNTLDKYYANDSTVSYDEGIAGDDWVAIGTYKTETYSYGNVSADIILLNSAEESDNKPVNDAMKAILLDYINTYKDQLTPEKIIKLFKEAQQTAFTKLEAIKNQSSASGYSIYGYGENTEGVATNNYDTYRGDGYYGVNSILINIMYEMERLISKEMLGL